MRSCRCFGTGGSDGLQTKVFTNEWPFGEPPMRNTVRKSSAARVLESRPVRAALPWRMPRARERMFHDDVSSAVEQRRRPPVAGSNPARHHWIAQMGRASVSETECRGFDSRSNHDLSRHDTRAQARPGNAPCVAVRQTPKASGAQRNTTAVMSPDRRPQSGRPVDACKRRQQHRRHARTPPSTPCRQRAGFAASAQGRFHFFPGFRHFAKATWRSPARGREHPNTIANQSDRTTRANQGDRNHELTRSPCSGPRGS